MEKTLSLPEIKSICGPSAYRRGREYYEESRVKELKWNAEESAYKAVVRGTRRYRVSIMFDDDGDYIGADCDCPAFDSFSGRCKHIAAALFELTDPAKEHLTGKPAPKEPPIPHGDIMLAQNLINSFGRATRELPPADREAQETGDREIINVEFTCKVIASSYRNRFFTIDMKLGTKRLYVIRNIKEFLKDIDRLSTYPLGKNFMLDLTCQAFRETDRKIIDMLIRLSKEELSYRELMETYHTKSYFYTERSLFIPPSAWEKILPYLKDANVRFEACDQIIQGIDIAEDPVTLHFTLGKPYSEGYQLEINGLDGLTIMEQYGCIIAGGRLHRLNSSDLEQFIELKDAFYHSEKNRIRIPDSHIDTFMDRVIPGLKKMGTLTVEKNVAEQIVQEPFDAKLYLDRNDDMLFVRLEYRYGEVVVRPLLWEAENLRGRILVRDIVREDKIRHYMDSHRFYISEDHLVYLADEDEIYRFLYHTLPEIKDLVEVYATPSVRSIMAEDYRTPKASIDIDAGTNWLEFSFGIDGIDEKDIRNILRSLVEKKRYYRLSDGAFISLEDKGYEEIRGLMEQMGIGKSQIKGSSLKLPVARGLSLIESAESQSRIKLGKAFRKLIADLKNPDNLEFDIPKELSPILRDYQKYGYQWIKTLSHYGFGGILADDMGLGKTIQSIAYILSERQHNANEDSPVLVVSPASLTYNWRNEFQRFAPSLKIIVPAGTKQERREAIESSSDTDVVITSYPLLRRDMDLYTERCFQILILDEAQAVKNHATQTAQAVREIQAGRRFALTGTPIENSLDELWSIFDSVFPELFTGKKKFSELTSQQVARKARPFLLRRLKSDVLKELPEKIETLQTSELTIEQKKLYMAYLARLQEETLQDLQADGFQKSRMKILAGLIRLRQLCCHPGLFLEGYGGGSGKLEQLLEIVGECLDSGKRFLIFSQFTEMLSIIKGELDTRHIPYFYLDGKTPPRDRVDLCSRFNDGENSIFLISLKAGGTGLNLTGADTVILYDLWWNPAVEQQAADRAHRIGQKNVVQVIRLIAQGTIEEKMHELQQKKKDLVDEVIKPGEESLSALSEKDIREILEINDPVTI